MNTREAKISASPDLNLATSGNKLDIEGKVGIPHAHIKPKKLPQSSVPVSADQIIVGDAGQGAGATDYQVSS